jgi:hypothetical protein
LAEQRIVAVGLLTQREVELLGDGFSRLWPVDNTPCFTELIQAIDEADRKFEQEHQNDVTSRSPVTGGGRY